MGQHYEQEITMRLSEEQALALNVALGYALTAYRDDLGDKSVSEAHPSSCVGFAKTLMEELGEVSLGNKNTRLVSYTMVPKTTRAGAHV